VAVIKIEIMALEKQRCDLNSSSNGERRGESGKKGINGRYRGRKGIMKKYVMS
jgi:hypothetical protein